MGRVLWVDLLRKRVLKLCFLFSVTFLWDDYCIRSEQDVIKSVGTCRMQWRTDSSGFLPTELRTKRERKANGTGEDNFPENQNFLKRKFLICVSKLQRSNSASTMKDASLHFKPTTGTKEGFDFVPFTFYSLQAKYMAMLGKSTFKM